MGVLVCVYVCAAFKMTTLMMFVLSTHKLTIHHTIPAYSVIIHDHTHAHILTHAHTMCAGVRVFM